MPLAYMTTNGWSCVSCAQNEFGPELENDVLPLDLHGSRVRSYAEGYEWWTGLYFSEELSCDNCGALIDERLNEDRCECNDGCPIGECLSCDEVADRDGAERSAGCSCDGCRAAEQWRGGVPALPSEADVLPAVAPEGDELPVNPYRRWREFPYSTAVPSWSRMRTAPNTPPEPVSLHNDEIAPETDAGSQIPEWIAPRRRFPLPFEPEPVSLYNEPTYDPELAPGVHYPPQSGFFAMPYSWPEDLSCPDHSRSAEGWGCERVPGHSGPHGAFSGRNRRGYAPIVWN